MPVIISRNFVPVQRLEEGDAMATPHLSLTTSNFLAMGARTLPWMLHYHAEAHPSAPFLIFEDAQGQVSHFSYADMERRANRMAHVLLTYGISKGQTFHVHLSNCPEFFDCWFAAAALGAIMVPTNPLSTTDELNYILSHADCIVSITQPDLLPALSEAQAQHDHLSILLARTEEAINSTSLLAHLISLFLAGYGIFHIPTGFLTYRFGLRNVLLAGILIESLGGIATAFAPSYGWLEVLRFITGIGASFFVGCGFAMVTSCSL